MRLDTLGSIGYTLLSCNEGGGGFQSKHSNRGAIKSGSPINSRLPGTWYLVLRTCASCDAVTNVKVGYNYNWYRNIGST